LLGVLDDAHLVREYAWKIVLDYLPQQRSVWDDEIAKKEEYYNDYLLQFMPEGCWPPNNV
jgi:hypothetical protein